MYFWHDSCQQTELGNRCVYMYVHTHRRTRSVYLFLYLSDASDCNPSLRGLWCWISFCISKPSDVRTWLHYCWCRYLGANLPVGNDFPKILASSVPLQPLSLLLPCSVQGKERKPGGFPTEPPGREGGRNSFFSGKRLYISVYWNTGLTQPYPGRPRGLPRSPQLERSRCFYVSLFFYYHPSQFPLL